MGFDVGYGGAFLAGLLSFVTPCVLPIVPFYLCYLTGLSMNDLEAGRAATGESATRTRRKLVAASLMFAFGVITIFVLLGASASSLGQLFRDWFDALKYAAAAVIALLGLHFIGVLRIPILYRQARVELGAPVSLAGAYLVGLAFAFGWTPCVGPILAAILFTAGARETAGDGALLLLFYGVGMTAPFVLAAAFSGPFLRWARSFRAHLQWIERFIGGILVLFALLIATDSVNIIAAWMLDVMPGFLTLG